MIRNVFSNYVSRVWGFVSVFIFVPIYIKLLGVEAYGVINLYTVILTIMYFADAGLSATLNREIARTSDNQHRRNLLYTIERLYLLISSGVFLVIFLGSGFIARKWLQTTAFSQSDLSLYISLIGFAVALQLFTVLENSGLMGLEKQVLANKIQVFGGMARSALVLVPLHFFPSLLTFFIWQCFVNLVVLLVTRTYLWRSIEGSSGRVYDGKLLRTVGGFAGGMMLMAIISGINTQIDKIVVSKLLSLKEFGYYSLAGVLAQLPVIAITPAAVALLPRMVRLIEAKREGELRALFHLSSFALAVLASAVALVLFLFTRELTLIWTHDAVIASRIDWVVKIMVIGNVFLTFQYMPYHLSIANGHTRTNVRLGIFVILLIVPLIPFCVSRMGLIGATIPWLIINILGFIYLGYFLLKRFMPGDLVRWFTTGIFMPLGVTLLVGFLAYNLLPAGQNTYLVLLYAVLVVIIVISINFLLYYLLHPELKVGVYKIITNGK